MIFSLISVVIDNEPATTTSMNFDLDDLEAFMSDQLSKSTPVEINAADETKSETEKPKKKKKKKTTVTNEVSVFFSYGF